MGGPDQEAGFDESLDVNGDIDGILAKVAPGGFEAMGGTAIDGEGVIDV
jgi:hypothetical protein